MISHRLRQPVSNYSGFVSRIAPTGFGIPRRLVLIVGASLLAMIWAMRADHALAPTLA